MNIEKMNSFIQKKQERQTILRERKNTLEVLDQEIFNAKFGRGFGTTYFFIKRFITLLIGIILILFALFVLISPEVLIENQDFKQELINDYKNDYIEIAGETLGDALIQLSSTNSNANRTDIINTLDKSFEKSIEKEIILGFQYLAVLILIIGIISLYISRLTKKIRIRNSKISKAESLTQKIINDYKHTINEEEQELELFKEIINETSN